jgi:hypothetical protein
VASDGTDREASVRRTLGAHGFTLVQLLNGPDRWAVGYPEGTGRAHPDLDAVERFAASCTGSK